jgi:hypothetical protein
MAKSVFFFMVSAFCVSAEKNLTLNSYRCSHKRAGGEAQVVECLPSKCEALSSNPTPVKKKFLSSHK